jgi:hypothetical protein
MSITELADFVIFVAELIGERDDDYTHDQGADAETLADVIDEARRVRKEWLG